MCSLIHIKILKTTNHFHISIMNRWDLNAVVLSKVEEVWEIPLITPSVLINQEYDIPNMKHIKTFRNVKHIYKDKVDGKIVSKKYSHTIITIEKYKESLTISELNRNKKNNLIMDIKSEIDKLILSDFKEKDAIMKFACDNGKSNGEKRLRATMLQKTLQKEQEEHYQRIRGDGWELLDLNNSGKAIPSKKRYLRMNDMILYYLNFQ